MYRKMKESNVEWIGKIPEKWEVIPLRYATININEKNNPVKMTNILSLTNTLGVVPYEEKGNQGNVSKEDLTQYKLAYKDTVIVNSMNLKIGSVGLSKYDGCVSPVYYVLKNTEKTDIRFINYLFQSNFQKYLSKFGKGIMEIREKISMYDVMHSYIPFPTLKEQIEISNYLDKKTEKINHVIESNIKIISLLEEYKKSLIDKEICSLNEKTCHLGLIADMKNGLNFNTEYTNKKIKFLGVGDISNDLYITDINKYSELDYEGQINDEYLLKNGDIIFVRSNGSKELVGRSIMVDNISYPVTYSGFCIRFRNLREDILNNKFLLLFFRSNYFRNELKRLSRGTNINNVNQELLSQISIYIPNIDKQNEIVEDILEKMETIEQVIQKKKAIIEKLEEYKKSLIYEVVTGKVEV